MKHFERDGKRPETRLLVRATAGGVFGAGYRWRADGSDAELVRERITADSWQYPGPDDCRTCHLPAAGGVLGGTTRQLNRLGPTGENQLVAWSRLGLLDLPVSPADLSSLPELPPLGRPGLDPETRARAYLDANCGHCHRPGGAAADFDARFQTPLAEQKLIDAPARINLGFDRARQIAPNDPWRSIALVRLATLEQAKMPPLAHERLDAKGGDILRDWIQSLPGPPAVAPPAVEPKGDEFAGPVTVTVRHPDPGAVGRYTLDGSSPTSASPVLAVPLRLTRSATVRARAHRPGHTASVVVQGTFVIGD